MQSFSSSAPAPDPGREPRISPSPPVPGPAVVPPRHPRRRRIAWGIPLVVAGVIAGVAFYLNTQSSANVATKGTIVSVATTVVGLGDVHATVRVNGTVGAQNFAALLAPRIQGSRTDMNRGGMGGMGGGGGGGAGGGGRGGGGGGGGGGDMGGRGGGGPMGDFSLVIMRLVKPGSHVKAGDVVCEFDPQLQAQRLDDYRDSVVQMENNIKKMLANLAASRESHDQQVRSAKADHDRAVLDLQTAEVRSAIDGEKFKLAVEETDLKHKELVRQSALVEESQQGQIRSSELDKDHSKIEMARAEANVQRMTIKSPMDGIVVMNTTNRSGDIGQIREGDSVASGQPFMSVVDPTSMVLNATVNQVDAERLRLGLKATVRLDAYGDIELPGTLIGIGAMAKISRFRAGYVGEIPVRLKIEKMDPRVIPDLTGSAQIVVNSERNTLILPREAIFEENGGPFVFLQGPQGWMRKKVDLGLPNFTAVAVHSGVQKGDVVAIQRPM